MMNEQELKTLLSAWEQKVEWWQFKIIHAVWVPNEMGGAMNKEHELLKAQAKVEILKQIINSPTSK